MTASQVAAKDVVIADLRGDHRGFVAGAFYNQHNRFVMSRKRRPPDSAAAFASRRADDLGRLRWCTYWLAHVVGLANPGSAFSPGERSGPGPGRKPLPQSGDVLRAQTERGEYPIAPLVQPLARVREVPVGQARIQPPGEADHLLHAEA